jgi:hypothetical protein
MNIERLRVDPHRENTAAKLIGFNAGVFLQAR